MLGAALVLVWAAAVGFGMVAFSGYKLHPGETAVAGRWPAGSTLRRAVDQPNWSSLPTRAVPAPALPRPNSPACWARRQPADHRLIGHSCCPPALRGLDETAAAAARDIPGTRVSWILTAGSRAFRRHHLGHALFYDEKAGLRFTAASPPDAP